MLLLNFRPGDKITIITPSGEELVMEWTTWRGRRRLGFSGSKTIRIQREGRKKEEAAIKRTA